MVAVQPLVSKVDGKLVAYLYRAGLVQSEREGPGDPDQTLQSTCKKLSAGSSFRQHSHLPLLRQTLMTQEAWIVISGRVLVTLTDINDAPLAECELGAGDCLVTFRGGHGMAVLEDTVLYELKNGPYYGQRADKRWVGP